MHTSYFHAIVNINDPLTRSHVHFRGYVDVMCGSKHICLFDGSPGDVMKPQHFVLCVTDSVAFDLSSRKEIRDGRPVVGLLFLKPFPYETKKPDPNLIAFLSRSPWIKREGCLSPSDLGKISLPV